MARSADVPVDPDQSVGAATFAVQLRETQEQLAAVNEVLSAVGRSAGDPDTVLATIVDSARACAARTPRSCASSTTTASSN